MDIKIDNKTLNNFTDCKDTSATAKCDECTQYSNGPFTLASFAETLAAILRRETTGDSAAIAI